MTESFVFYQSFVNAAKYLPRKQYLNILAAVCEYGIAGKEPEGLVPVERAMFEAFRPQIDANAQRRESGKKGGKQKIGITAEELRDAYEDCGNWNDVAEKFGISQRTVFYILERAEVQGANEMQKPSAEVQKPNENVNENVNVNVNENAHTQRACENSPAENYAGQVFDVFNENGLPCVGGDKIMFFSQDFRYGLDELHKSGMNLHSSDVIQAVKNYAKVIEMKKRGETWWNSELDFFTLCKSKNILKFLPGAFSEERFKRKENPRNGAGKKQNDMIRAVDDNIPQEMIDAM